MLPDPTKIESAFHEAGHAVIAHRSKYLRIKPGASVSIVLTDGEHGGVDVETDPNATAATEWRMVYEMSLIAAAGRIAQHRYLEENNLPIDQGALNAGASDDYSYILRHFGVGVFFEFGAVVQSRFDHDGLWDQVKLIAQALMRKDTLTSSEVEAIIGPR